MISRTLLKSKIHRAVVTEANIDYEGSITIDKDIMDAVDILENEHVHVLSLSSGARLETYAIGGTRGSAEVCVNGAAAKLVLKGETVIIVSYAQVPDDESETFSPKVVVMDDKNRIVDIKEKGPALDFVENNPISRS